MSTQGEYTCTGILKIFIEHRYSRVAQWLLKVWQLHTIMYKKGSFVTVLSHVKWAIYRLEIDGENIPIVRQNMGKIWGNLEIAYKVFFCTDSCSSDIDFEESEWWHFVIIECFEIIKMAYWMAAICYYKNAMTCKSD